MTAPTAAGRPIRFLGAAFAMAVLIVGTNMPSPLYSVYSQRFGFSPLTVTLIVSVYVAVLLPSMLLLGPLADRGGPRPVLVPAFVLALGAAALFSLADDTWWLFVARAAQGLAVGAASAPLTVALIRTEPSGDRRRASLAGALMTTGGAGLGPVIAGAFAQYGPAPIRTTYLVEAGLLAVALVAVGALPSTPETGPRRRQIRRPEMPSAGRGPFLVAAFASFLAWAVAYVILALLPSFARTATHSHNLLLGGATSGGLLLCAAIVQIACARSAAAYALGVGLALLCAGLAGLIVAGFVVSTPLLLLTVVVAGAGQGLSFMGALRRVNDLAAPEQRSGVLASFYVITYLGGGGPVVVVGLLATEVMSLTAAVQTAAATLLGGCLLTLLGLARTGAVSAPGPAGAPTCRSRTS
jgi:predicted MFS family arabinose efflux permease